MHVAIIGAAGMIGRKLTARLVVDGRLGDLAINRLTLLDVVEPEPPDGWTGAAGSAAGPTCPTRPAPRRRWPTGRTW